MKTIQDFFKKYGTGINYQDYYVMMLHGKRSNDSYFRGKYEEFKKDLETLLNNTFSEDLWQDWKYLLSY